MNTQIVYKEMNKVIIVKMTFKTVTVHLLRNITSDNESIFFRVSKYPYIYLMVRMHTCIIGNWDF